MGTFSWILVGLAVTGAAFHLRVGLRAGTAAVAAVLLAWTFLGGAGALTLILGWLPFLAVAAVLNVPRWRRRLLTDPAFALFQRSLPALSRTEREALEAGTVWWDGDLFSGAPRWRRLLEAPVPVLTEREQAFLDGPTEDLCRMLDDWAITHEDRDLPPEVWAFIKEQGFFGMIIPEEHGGLGFSPMAHSAVVMRIATRSVTAAVTVMVPNSLGPAELLLHHGTEAQKNHYLPRLARGAEVPCFALTGPEAGSDAGAMADTGVICRQEFRGEADVLGIRLNWEKRYITLGPVATVLGLAFRLYDPDHLLGEQEDLGITLALIPTDLEGIEIGRRHLPMGLPFQNGPNRGRDVFIPVDWIIGGRERAGQGWRMLVEALAAGRSISLPALSTGAGKLAARATGAYARIREQFHRPIGHFEGVGEALGRIAGHTYRMDATRRLTAAAAANGERPAVLTAIAKYQLTEAMRTVVNDAMDVHGGKAVCTGPRNLMARAYQAVPVGITVEGANILTRSMIIFGQGAIRCHPYLLREMEAAADGDAADFDEAITGHAGFTVSNAVRALVLGLTGGLLTRVRGPRPVRAYARQLTRMSAAFALTADAALLTLGGRLKHRERLSGRLADALSHLYMASAVLRHFTARGAPAEDLPLVRWACDDSLYRIQEALIDFDRNFPVRPVAWVLRALAFPRGQRQRKPADSVESGAAGTLLEPGPARDGLTAGIHLPTAADEPLAQLEDALERTLATEPIARKVREAVRAGVAEDGPNAGRHAHYAGIIDDGEAAAFEAAAEARRRVIAVDDFPPDLGPERGPESGEPEGATASRPETASHDG